MSENPYAAPRASVADIAAQGGEKVKLYSPNQVGVGAFLGGPVAAVYMLAVNFRALNRGLAENRTWRWGALIVLATTVGVCLLPDEIPSFPINIVWVLIAGHIAGRAQMGKSAIAASERHVFQSNWRVLGISILAGIATLGLILPIAMLLDRLGWLSS